DDVVRRRAAEEHESIARFIVDDARAADVERIVARQNAVPRRRRPGGEHVDLCFARALIETDDEKALTALDPEPGARARRGSFEPEIEPSGADRNAAALIVGAETVDACVRASALCAERDGVRGRFTAQTARAARVDRFVRDAAGAFAVETRVRGAF